MLKFPNLSGVGKDLRDTAKGLLRRGRKGVDTLADTLGDQAQVIRLAAKVRQLNRERAELLKEIGRKVYTLHTLAKVTNRDVLADCRKVDDIGERIAALRRQIDDLRTGPEAHVTVEVEDDSPLSAELSDEAEQEPVTAAEAPAMPKAAPAEQVLEVAIAEDVPDLAVAQEAPSLPGPAPVAPPVTGPEASQEEPLAQEPKAQADAD